MPRKKKSTGKKNNNFVEVRTGLGRKLSIDLRDLPGKKPRKSKLKKKSVTRVIPGSPVYGKPRYKK